MGKKLGKIVYVLSSTPQKNCGKFYMPNMTENFLSPYTQIQRGQPQQRAHKKITHENISQMQVGSHSYEPNAFKFGNGPFSYSMVKIAPDSRFWHRNFSIKFDFRTFYPDGFLFAAPVSW